MKHLASRNILCQKHRRLRTLSPKELWFCFYAFVIFFIYLFILFFCWLYNLVSQFHFNDCPALNASELLIIISILLPFVVCRLPLVCFIACPGNAPPGHPLHLILCFSNWMWTTSKTSVGISLKTLSVPGLLPFSFLSLLFCIKDTLPKNI